MRTSIFTWNSMRSLRDGGRSTGLNLETCEQRPPHRTAAVHFVQERESIFRSGLLVLTRHQLAVDNDVRIVRRHPRVHRANLFENGLRIVRNEVHAPE